MVSRIRIYIEGRGIEDDEKDNKGTRNARALREGFDGFFNQIRTAGGLNGDPDLWKNIACGPRGRAFKDYKIGRSSDPDATHILLVDSEGPVPAESSPWHYLQQKREDNWGGELCEKDEGCVHLMVQAMEAWLIADKEALKRFYGAGFKEAKIPKIKVGEKSEDGVESIPKAQLVIALEAATRESERGKYHKTRNAFKALATLDPAKVRKAAPHCDALFEVLETLIGLSTE